MPIEIYVYKQIDISMKNTFYRIRRIRNNQKSMDHIDYAIAYCKLTFEWPFTTFSNNDTYNMNKKKLQRTLNKNI